MPGLVGTALEPSLSVNCELWYGGRPQGEREEFGHRSQRVSMLWGSMETSHPYFQSWAAAAKSLQSCPTLCDPIDGAHQAPPTLGFSRQEHWASPCNRRSLSPSEDNITRNRMMHATEDEVCEWFPGGTGVTEKPASWLVFV